MDDSTTLPDALLRLLDGTRLSDKIGETLLLLTVAADGFPHIALLSVGEVFAPSDHEVRFALWPKSTTTGNLTGTGRGTLVYVLVGAAIYVQLTATRVPDDETGFARFISTPQFVRLDRVGYAELESGVRFRLRDPGATVARWEAMVERLRAL